MTNCAEYVSQDGTETPYQPPTAIFWMVWREGGQRPQAKHDNYNAACAEAERIAQRHPGFKTYVLQSLAVVETVGPVLPPVKWENLGQ